MGKKIWHIISLAALLVVATTGCLRSASGDPGELPEGLARSTNTPESTLTFTPGPTATPIVVVTEVAVEVTSIVEVTSTPGPTDTPGPPTNTPTLTPTPTSTVFDTTDSVDASAVTPTVAVVADAQAAPEDEGIIVEEQQVPTATLDPLFAQATQFVIEATQEAANLTATAEGPAQAQPTFTPQPQATATPAGPVATAVPTQGPTAQPTAPGAVTGGSDCFHEVVAGENLFRLSIRYGLDVSTLASANNISNIQLIVVGDTLRIPGCGTTGVRPPATSVPAGGGDFAGTNQVGGTTGGATAGGQTYTVQQGDTLFEISLRFGVPVNSIVASNPSISDPNFIVMTEEIVIPNS